MGTETHEIVVMKPKPHAEEIARMTSAYFDAKGKEYDQFDKKTEKRDLFTEKVNELIAGSYQAQPQIKKVISIACGTGRREKEIEALTARTLHFSGVEISAEMCKQAASRGVNMVQGAWLAVPPIDQEFHSALLLSAFGHVPTKEERIKFLKKISAALVPGGSLYLDVLNIEDRSEWGPRIDEIFKRENLANHGFDRGDVLYRKIGEAEVCFYHYFSTAEIQELLQAAGFHLKSIHYIGYGANFGQLRQSANEGAIFVEAQTAAS